MYKTVFIDLDDTLWDFHANAKATLQDVFQAKSLSLFFRDFEHFFDLYIHRNYELWEQYGKGLITKEELQTNRFAYPFQKIGLDQAVLAEEVGNTYFEVLPTKTALINGAIEVLEYLYMRYPLTIISNGFKQVQTKKIDSSGLRKYFRHIVLSEEANSIKPNPQIFEYALQLNQSKASETIMIGDSFDADIAGAKAAGIDQLFYSPTIHVNTKNKPFQPTWEIQRLIEILQIL